MDFQIGSSSIKLLKYQDDTFQVFSGKKGLSLKIPLKLAFRELLKLGVGLSEVEYAILEMQSQGTNVAEFGVFRKSFMYSTRETLQEPLYGNS